MTQMIIWMKSPMTRLISVCSIVFFLLCTPLYAYELLMFHSKTCPYCQAFMVEVYPTYKDTEASKTLPLKIIDASKPPKWFIDSVGRGDIKPIRGVPTFIIYDEENFKEMDRMVGYNGYDWFIERVNYWIENYKEYYGVETKKEI